jgi:hypothetical protein
MRRLLIALACAACGGGQQSSPPPPAAPPACPTTMDGPFARWIVAPHPPPPTGGVIPDGTYDLAFFVVDEVDTRPGHTLEAVRMQLTFKTDQRDAQHQEGALYGIFGTPPEVICRNGRFAVVGTTLRSLTPMKGLDAQQFSVTSDGFVMHTPGGGRMDPKAVVWKRR